MSLTRAVDVVVMKKSFSRTEAIAIYVDSALKEVIDVSSMRVGEFSTKLQAILDAEQCQERPVITRHHTAARYFNSVCLGSPRIAKEAVPTLFQHLSLDK